MELYLMGLLPSGSVSSYIVFDDQTQDSSSTLNGPVETVSAADVIATEGARSPAWPAAQSHFRVATIVVSQSFLGADAMSFLDYFAARGSMAVPLGFSSGFVSGTTWPFYLATGRRGCLITTIDYDTGCPHLQHLPLIGR